MRNELNPDMAVAKKLYPQIKELLEKYTEYVDEYGDEENLEYKKVEEKLHEITGKNMSGYNIWEYWEAEGLEVEAFRISLPDPNIVNDITKNELNEIIEIMNKNYFDDNGEYEKIEGEDEFTHEFKLYLSDYYHELLKINFKKKYDQYFFGQKGKGLNIEEKIEKMLGKK
jgi:hypothetical protein